MGQNQKNQGRQNRNPQQRREDNSRQQSGEVLDVVFVQDPPGSDRLVSYMGDLTVYPVDQLRPIPGKHYQCLLMQQQGGRRPIARAKPCVIELLTAEEWIQKETLRQCIVEEIAFRQDKKEGKDRMISFRSNGMIVFPDRGFDPKPGETYSCMLRVKGRVAFALPVPRDARSSSTTLVTMGDAIGPTKLREMGQVVMTMVRKRPDVAVAKSDSDLVMEQTCRNVYSLLSVKDDQGRVIVEVSESSSEAEIHKAYKLGVPRLHPDKKEQLWTSKKMVMPYELRRLSENLFAAFTEAKEVALELLKSRKGQGEQARTQRREKRSERPAAAQPAEAAVQAETQKVEAPQAAEATATEDDENVKAAAMAKLTIEEFLAKPANLQNHYRKAVRRETRSVQSAAVPAAKPKAKKETIQKGQGLAALASLKVGEEK